MSTNISSGKELYSEAEAAEFLGISISQLHQLLDTHIFTTEDARPTDLAFQPSDLLLLGYWNRTAA